MTISLDSSRIYRRRKLLNSLTIKMRISIDIHLLYLFKIFKINFLNIFYLIVKVYPIYIFKLFITKKCKTINSHHLSISNLPISETITKLTTIQCRKKLPRAKRYKFLNHLSNKTITIHPTK